MKDNLFDDPVNETITVLAKLLAMMRLSAYIVSLYAIVQGILIVIGGPARFSARAYSMSMALPGAPSSWGLVLLACGIIAFIGIKNRMYRLGCAGMFGASAWSFCFGGSFLVSALQYPDANLTAIAVYGKDGVLFVLMAIGQWTLSRARTKPEDYDA